MLAREEILEAVVKACESIEGVGYVARDPVDPIPEGTGEAVCVFGGDVTGPDHPVAFESFGRLSAWPVTLDVELYLYAEGNRAGIGRKINSLAGRTLQALWTSADLRTLLDGDGGMVLVEAQFHPPEAGGQAAAAASMIVRIGAVINPANP